MQYIINDAQRIRKQNSVVNIYYRYIFEFSIISNGLE